MINKINLQKIKFSIVALIILSVISINTFSAPKETKKLEWKQIPESSGATFSVLENESGVFRAKLENLSHYMLNSDWIQIPFS